MNIQPRYPTTPDEFLLWNEDREGKREFVRGRVVEMMTYVTRNHMKLASRLVVALSARLDPDAYDVGSADFAIRTPDGIRFPDVFVDRVTPEATGEDLTARAPVFLAEVLSPSSRRRDFVEKQADYQSVETVQHYLILSPTEPRIWLSTRMAAGWDDPHEIAGLDGSLSLSSLGVELPMAELYAGIGQRA